MEIPINKRIKICVTKNHIKNGKINSGSCPIALAIIDKLNLETRWNTDISLPMEESAPKHYISVVLGGIDLKENKKGSHFTSPLSLKAKKFVMDFDFNKKVKPTSFYLKFEKKI